MAQAMAVQLTKSQARKAFGWVPKEMRGTNTLIHQLKELGLQTKQDFKEHMRTVVMPAQQQGLKAMLNSIQQSEQQVQKAEQKVSKPKQVNAIAKNKTHARALLDPKQKAGVAQTQQMGQQHSQKQGMKMSMAKK